MLAPVGVTTEIATDPDAGIARVDRFDLLILNMLRWRMVASERHAPLRRQWGYETSAALRDGMAHHLARGGGVLAMHTASICFDDWPEWRDILGAAWQWDISRHDPPGPARISFAGAHPLTEGLPDFTLSDEIYTGLALAGDATPLAWAVQGDDPARHPVLLAREVGGGRIVYDALGHDAASIAHPAHAALTRRAIGWLHPAGDDDA